MEKVVYKIEKVLYKMAKAVYKMEKVVYKMEKTVCKLEKVVCKLESSIFGGRIGHHRTVFLNRGASVPLPGGMDRDLEGSMDTIVVIGVVIRSGG